MPIKIDWLSLAIGIAIGLLIGKLACHDKSPISDFYTNVGIS